MNNNQDTQENLSNQFAAGYFRNAEGTVMSISAAVTNGLVYRSETKGCIVKGGATIFSEYAIRAGIIDKAAAIYIQALPGTDKPAPFTRVDQVAPENESMKLDTASSVIEALGKFFTNPEPLSKQIAIESLTAHMEASKASQEAQAA